MDTYLGKVNLTTNQTSRLSEINSVKGLCYWHESGKLIAATEEALSEKEKTSVLNEVKALSDEPIGKKETLEERVAKIEKEIKTEKII